MPELPEVETTRLGLQPHVEGRRVSRVVLHRPDLRWPIPEAIRTRLPGQRIHAIRRRAKYLLFDTDAGSALVHLGMTGSLRVLPGESPRKLHDHVEILLSANGDAPGQVICFNDPRRFGCLLWQAPGELHPLLAALGPEPLSDGFDGAYLFHCSRGRKAPVKAFLMDQSVVVGVGNIYAAEALFMAGISPLRAAGSISKARYGLLAEAAKGILAHAIQRGGTTLRDFIRPDGTPGYFEQELLAYGRGGQPCRRCGRTLRQALIGQRTSVWCGRCQR